MKKKTTFIVAFLLMVVAATAQSVKISPKMTKGMKKTYRMESVTDIAGREVKFSNTQQYVVAGETDGGYQLDCTITDCESSGPSDQTTMLMLMAQQLSEDITSRLKTDADGKVTGLLNAAETKQLAMDAASKMLDSLLARFPQIQQMMSRDALQQQLTEQMTEERMVKAMQEATSVLALNGRQIASGAQDEYVNAQGLKMKRTYILTKKDGSALVTNAKMNMTKDELKKSFLDQVEKAMPAQAEMIRQNIDMVMEQMTFDATEKAVYEFGPDGWVSTLNIDNSIETLGQKANIKVTIKAVE